MSVHLVFENELEDEDGETVTHHGDLESEAMAALIASASTGILPPDDADATAFLDGIEASSENGALCVAGWRRGAEMVCSYILQQMSDMQAEVHHTIEHGELH